MPLKISNKGTPTMPMFNLTRCVTGNYLEFGEHRITLDARAEHSLLTILKYGEHGTLEDASGVLWELNPDGEGKFEISTPRGHHVATIGVKTATDLITDLSAIIMGA